MSSVSFLGEEAPKTKEDQYGSPFEKYGDTLLNKAVKHIEKTPAEIAFQKGESPRRVPRHNRKGNLRFPAPVNH